MKKNLGIFFLFLFLVALFSACEPRNGSTSNTSSKGWDDVLLKNRFSETAIEQMKKDARACDCKEAPFEIKPTPENILEYDRRFSYASESDEASIGQKEESYHFEDIKLEGIKLFLFGGVPASFANPFRREYATSMIHFFYRRGKDATVVNPYDSPLGTAIVSLIEGNYPPSLANRYASRFNGEEVLSFCKKNYPPELVNMFPELMPANEIEKLCTLGVRDSRLIQKYYDVFQKHGFTNPSAEAYGPPEEFKQALDAGVTPEVLDNNLTFLSIYKITPKLAEVIRLHNLRITQSYIKAVLSLGEKHNKDFDLDTIIAFNQEKKLSIAALSRLLDIATKYSSDFDQLLDLHKNKKIPIDVIETSRKIHANKNIPLKADEVIDLYLETGSAQFNLLTRIYELAGFYEINLKEEDLRYLLKIKATMPEIEAKMREAGLKKHVRGDEEQ